jgi:hypothetical protein
MTLFAENVKRRALCRINIERIFTGQILTLGIIRATGELLSVRRMHGRRQFRVDDDLSCGKEAVDEFTSGEFLLFSDRRAIADGLPLLPHSALQLCRVKA